MKDVSSRKSTLNIVIFAHLFLWLIFVFVTGYAFYYKQPDKWLFGLARKTYELFSFTLITVSVYILLEKTLAAIQKTQFKVLFFFIVYAITALIIELNILLYSFLTGETLNVTFSFFLLLALYQFIYLLPFMIFYLTLKYWKESNAEKERAAQMTVLAREAQLEMLSYQLNPHFLFNALNTLKALINVDKDMAREIIDDLSDYLRSNLDKKNRHTIPLTEEFDSTCKYLNIQKKRFGEKISIHTGLEDTVREISVPPFVIQPLIENAIKYGTETCKDILEISLEVRKEVGKVIIIVRNSGTISRDDTHAGGTGIGLENMKKRLYLYYENNFEFNLSEIEKYVVAEIKLGTLKHA